MDTIVGSEGVFARLIALTLEEIPYTGLAQHLGYERYAPEKPSSGNGHDRDWSKKAEVVDRAILARLRSPTDLAPPIHLTALAGELIMGYCAEVSISRRGQRLLPNRQRRIVKPLGRRYGAPASRIY